MFLLCPSSPSTKHQDGRVLSRAQTSFQNEQKDWKKTVVLREPWLWQLAWSECLPPVPGLAQVWGVQAPGAGPETPRSSHEPRQKTRGTIPSPHAPSRAFLPVTLTSPHALMLLGYSHTFLEGGKSPSDVEILFGRVSLRCPPKPSSPNTKLKGNKNSQNFKRGGLWTPDFYFSLIIPNLCDPLHPSSMAVAVRGVTLLGTGCPPTPASVRPPWDQALLEKLKLLHLRRNWRYEF